MHNTTAHAGSSSAQRMLFGDFSESAPTVPPVRISPPRPLSTKCEAAIAAAPKSPSRRARILDAVRRAGSAGMTRDELAVALTLPIQSVTSPVRQLLDAGELRELEITRPTRWGHAAAVLVAGEGTN